MTRTQVCLGLWVLILFLALASAAGAVSPDLLGWWKFDDGAGATAADSSGRGNDGTLRGGPQWIVGQLGGALSFNGSSTYVEIPYSSVFDKPAQLTLAAWVNPTTFGAWCGIITFGINSAPYALQTWSDGAIRLSANWGTVTGGVGSGSWNSAAGAMKLAQWQHIAVTYDGAMIRFYCNGLLVTETPRSLTLGSLSESVTIGADFAGGDEYFTGGIDDPRIYGRALSDVELWDAMLGRGSGEASMPDPKARATDVPRDAVLGWTAGQYAQTHDVYFGTVFDDVNNASRSSPMGVLVSRGQAALTYDPAGLLTFGQTYYWRVDEVNGTPDFAIFKGDVWSFQAETYGYPVQPTKATASSSSNSLTGPAKTIDGSGLDALDQHSTSSSHMWLSKKGQSPIWIQYEFDAVYSFYQMWVWNSNQQVESLIGFGARDVTIEYSTDGVAWTALANVPEFAQAPGDPNYVHNTTVEFGGVQAKFVKLTIHSNWADGTKQAGLSEVRFFYVPVKAFRPNLASGSPDLALDAVLNWRPGREAAKHQVLLSSDVSAVTEGRAVVATGTSHSLDLKPLALDYGTTYYWRITEVNDAANPKSWEGDVWSFTTRDYTAVDDFESYDDKCNRIFFAWVDGFGFSASPDCGLSASAGNGTGSTVGNANPPFAEKTVIHGGRQSMPLGYDNTAGTSLSEATRTFDAAQDWTLGGAKTLVLYFHGQPDNGAGQLYVKINGCRVVYSGKAEAITMPVWRQWNIDLASSGANVKAVQSLTVGVSGSGKGMLLIDDIRLYRDPAVVESKDPGNSGLSASYAFDGDVKDSSGKGYDGTSEGNPVFVDDPGFGKAIQLDGIDDCVVLPIGPLVNTLTSATLSMRVNFSRRGGSWQRIFDFGSGINNCMYLSPSALPYGGMWFGIQSPISTAESVISTDAQLPMGWRHVAVVIDGTSKTVRLYVDGGLVASVTTNRLPKDLGNTTQNWLGKSQWGPYDPLFAGALDEFRIYNRALSEGEVRYLAGDR